MRTKSTRFLGRLAATAVCTVAIAGGTAAASHASTSTAPDKASAAAAARPTLKVPFPCNEEWRGQTWSGHSPDRAIDFNQGSGNSDLGQTVKSSGSGTVTAAGVGEGGYGNRVIVSHGNGWSTLYAHLNSISVHNGQAITANTTIGTVGKSGGQATSHLHYEQRLNGNDVSIRFGSATWVKYYETAYFTRTVGC